MDGLGGQGVLYLASAFTFASSPSRRRSYVSQVQSSPDKKSTHRISMDLVVIEIEIEYYIRIPLLRTNLSKSGRPRDSVPLRSGMFHLRIHPPNNLSKIPILS